MSFWIVALIAYAALLSARYAYVAYRYGMRGWAIRDMARLYEQQELRHKTLVHTNVELQEQVAWWKAQAEATHEACARKIKRL